MYLLGYGLFILLAVLALRGIKDAWAALQGQGLRPTVGFLRRAALSSSPVMR